MTGELTIYENFLSDICFTAITILSVGSVIFGIIIFILLLKIKKCTLNNYEKKKDKLNNL